MLPGAHEGEEIEKERKEMKKRGNGAGIKTPCRIIQLKTRIIMRPFCVCLAQITRKST